MLRFWIMLWNVILEVKIENLQYNRYFRVVWDMKNDKRIISGRLFIDRWEYATPSAKPDNEGRIIAISKKSVTPLEVFEWGLTADHRCFEKYKWCENDLFEDSNYETEISKEEFTGQIENMKELVSSTELSFWVELYDEIIRIIDSW